MSTPAIPPQLAKQRRRIAHRQGVSTSSSQDASEEDNDEQTDDASSTIFPQTATNPSSTAKHPSAPSAGKSSGIKRTAASGIHPVTTSRLAVVSDADDVSEGIDSPTYDGDVESTHLASSLAQAHLQAQQQARGIHQPHNLAVSSSSTEGSSSNKAAPKTPRPFLVTKPSQSENIPPETAITDAITHPLPSSAHLSAPNSASTAQHSLRPRSSDLGPPKMTVPPEHLSVENIRAFVQRAIDGESEQGYYRDWKTNAAPTDRPVRVYADGVYDLFHFGHALQLRQAKLSFPNVHLIVGVCSDDLCAEYKSAPAMTHAERCEAVLHCRWVDEIAPHAPWEIDQEFLDKHQIDYVAHDEILYRAKGVEDVYDFVKKQGRFLPTRRTPSISTSDLLERIVRGYRDGFFDSKLEKNGHPELMASDVDWDSSTSFEKVAARKKAAGASKTAS